jgi:hypothetical protein
MHLRLPGLAPDWQVATRPDGTVAARLPGVCKLAVAPARPLPVDWSRWVRAMCGGTLAGVPRELYTRRSGWSVTLAVALLPEGERQLHAFYVAFDEAIHATATFPGASDEALLARLAELFLGGELVWSDAPIAALADL